MSFSPERYQEQRERREKSKEQLAVESGCSYSSITQYETGLSRPSLGAIERIAAALDVHPGEFFDDELADAS